MLQQTQAPRVEPIFRSFVARWPSVRALAAARRADVVRAWSGLGYNRRAVALHDAAREIVRDHRGRVPRDPPVLRRLPGVGPYTAAAVASIAFGAPIAAPDTNARRIVARLERGAEPDEVPRRELAPLLEAWVDPGAPGDWNQALMDLGREVCRPAPRCEVCPVATWCRFRAGGRRGRSSSRRQPTFEGSRRQARGAIVELLRAGAADRATLAERLGMPPELADEALAALLADGLVAAQADRVRLA
jgi:A/G-specific adenine glycosylase